MRLDPSFCPTPSPPRCHPFETCDILWTSILVLIYLESKFARCRIVLQSGKTKIGQRFSYQNRQFDVNITISKFLCQLNCKSIIVSVLGTVCSSDVSLAPNWLFSGSRQCMMRRGKIPSDTHHRENQTWTKSANSRCAGPKPNGTRACDGYRSSKYDDLSKMKKDDDQKKPRVPLPSRADADALRTCWRCLARITLDRRHKRWQTHLVSVGGTLWGWGLWMNKLARQPSKLLWFKADYLTLAAIS